MKFLVKLVALSLRVPAMLIAIVCLIMLFITDVVMDLCGLSWSTNQEKVDSVGYLCGKINSFVDWEKESIEINE